MRPFGRRRLEADLEAELRGHLEMAIRERTESGESAEQARDAALRELGNEGLIRDAVREQWGGSFLESVLQDARYAARALARTPGFSLAAVLALALGIGANTAMLSVVEGILLRPLPYADSERLVVILHRGDNPVAPANFLDWRRESRSFEGMGAAEAWSPNLNSSESPERLQALRMTADLLPMLGVRPLLGRVFLPEEEKAGGDHVAVIGFRLWQRRFGGDPGVLGRTLRLNGEAYGIVGVMPESFRFAPFWATSAELWAPLALGSRADSRNGSSLRVFARRRADVPLAQARAEMAAITGTLDREFPGTNREVTVTPLKEKVVGDVRPALLVLLGAVGLVLLISCANVAHMLLARAAARRAPAPAGRGAGRAGAALDPGGLPGHRPRLRHRARSPERGSRSRGASGGSEGRDGPRPCTAAQAAGRVGAGSGPRAPGGRGPDAAQLPRPAGRGSRLRPAQRGQSGGLRGRHPPGGAGAARRVLSRAPGARLVGPGSARGLGHQPPAPGRGHLGVPLRRGGPARSPGRRVADRDVSRGLPRLLRAMGIPLLRGRDVAAADDLASPGVVVINEFMARHQWPGQDAVGQRITLDDADGKPVWLTVVGVYLPALQTRSYLEGPGPMTAYVTLVVRSEGEPAALVPALRSAVWSLDPALPISEVQTLEQVVAEANSGSRFQALLLGLFAALATVLAATGLYAVMSYAVSRRTREIGVRMAFGAGTREVLRLLVGEAMLVALLGTLAGVAGALLLSRLMARVLFGVGPADPATYCGVAAFLLAVALVSSSVPARRALRISPLAALRQD